MVEYLVTVSEDSPVVNLAWYVIALMKVNFIWLKTTSGLPCYQGHPHETEIK